MKTLLKLILVVGTFAGAFANGQEQGHLNVRTVVQKEEVITDDSGETTRRIVPAESVVPGEHVIYTITFTNISDETADNIVITNPISADLTYVEGSAFGPGTVIEFSIDGGQSFASAERLVISAAGVERPAEAADFTHVRWTLQNELAAGAQGMARFRATLN